MDEPLATYLHDHLAGSRFAIDLLGALRDEYAGEELGRFAADLLQEVDEDRQLLRKLVDRIGSPGSSLIKEAGAWIGEKGIRLKLGTPRHGLGTLQALEVLGMGIQGKLALWRALQALAPRDRRLQDIDFDRLTERARDQHARVEEHRMAAVRRLGEREAEGTPND